MALTAQQNPWNGLLFLVSNKAEGLFSICYLNLPKALTTLLAGAVTGGQLDSRFARLLNKYNTLGPELLKILPKETTSGLSLDDSLGALDGFGTSIASYRDIDFDSLKAAGYTELAEDMEIAAGLGLVAGEIGLEALKV